MSIFSSKIHDSLFQWRLMGRCQSVCVSGAISASWDLTFSFPQGSVPGSIASYFTWILFLKLLNNTDNTQFYLPFALSETDANRAVILMEVCIDDIQKWMVHNKLILNEDKTDT